MVMAIVKQYFPKPRQAKRNVLERYKIATLKDEKVKQQFEQEITTKLVNTMRAEVTENKM